jgi:adenosylhomocysteinase
VSQQDYVIADIGLAEFGRAEIAIAETEMPGLMALRDEFGPTQPLKGARITGSLHMTIQTAVLIETLVALGADVRWATCNIYSTQDHAAAAIAAGGIPVFAIKGESLAEYWDYVGRIFDWDGSGRTANLILDDGGDATMFACGRARRAGENAEPANAEEIEFQRAQGIHQAQARLPHHERRSSGRFGRNHHRRSPPLSHRQGRQAAFPGDQRERFGDQVEVRQPLRLQGSLVDAIRRATDVMLAGKVACVAGFGDVGKGSAASLRNGGARVVVTEIDPICALQAAMEGYEVVTMEEAVKRAEIFVTATGNEDVITAEHMKAMKPMSIVCNIGHFDSEIQISALSNYKWTEVKPGTDLVEFPDGKQIIILAKAVWSIWAAPPVTPASSCRRASPTRCWRSSSSSPRAPITKTTFTCCPSISTKRSRRCISPSSACS